MNKSNIIVAVVAITVLLVIGSAQTSRTVTGTVGRFQLLSGEHVVSGKTTTFDQKDVFRIDTLTGETSFFTTGYDRDGKVYTEWAPIK